MTRFARVTSTKDSGCLWAFGGGRRGGFLVALSTEDLGGKLPDLLGSFLRDEDIGAGIFGQTYWRGIEDAAGMVSAVVEIVAGHGLILSFLNGGDGGGVFQWIESSGEALVEGAEKLADSARIKECVAG